MPFMLLRNSAGTWSQTSKYEAKQRSVSVAAGTVKLGMTSCRPLPAGGASSGLIASGFGSGRQPGT